MQLPQERLISTTYLPRETNFYDLSPKTARLPGRFSPLIATYCYSWWCVVRGARCAGEHVWCFVCTVQICRRTVVPVSLPDQVIMHHPVE